MMTKICLDMFTGHIWLVVFKSCFSYSNMLFKEPSADDPDESCRPKRSSYCRCYWSFSLSRGCRSLCTFGSRWSCGRNLHPVSGTFWPHQNSPRSRPTLSTALPPGEFMHVPEIKIPMKGVTQWKRSLARCRSTRARGQNETSMERSKNSRRAERGPEVHEKWALKRETGQIF